MKNNQVKRLGRRIRDIRLSKGVSLRGLANLTGLTRSFLSQVEREKATPSISSLEKITRALNMGLNHFFKEEFPKKFSIIRKKRKGKFVAKTLKTSCELLVSDILDISIVPLLFTLNVGGKLEKAQLETYKKERFMIVQRGKIELVCATEDKRKFVLEEGDSLYCKCNVPCEKMSNVGGKKAIMLWVVRAPLL